MKATLKKMAVTLRILLLAIASITFANVAQAEVITFDDINGNSYPDLGVGYHGLNWGTPGSEIHVLDAVTYCTTCGYRNNMVSANNVAFNWNGSSPRDITVTTGTFSVVGGWWGAAWGDQFLTFEGYNNGNLLYSSAGNFVSTTAPVYIGLNWAGIDQFRIVGTGDWWVLDNFEVNAAEVPEPAVLGLFALGLMGFVAARRRRA